jgi:hypothetical protein
MPEELFNYYMDVLQVASVNLLNADFRGTYDQIMTLESSVTIFDISMISKAILDNRINPKDVFVVKRVVPLSARAWRDLLLQESSCNELASLAIVSENTNEQQLMVSKQKDSSVKQSKCDDLSSSIESLNLETTSKRLKLDRTQASTSKAPPSLKPVQSKTASIKDPLPVKPKLPVTKALPQSAKLTTKKIEPPVQTINRPTTPTLPNKLQKQMRYRSAPNNSFATIERIKSDLAVRLRSVGFATILYDTDADSVEQHRHAIESQDNRYILDGLAPMLRHCHLIYSQSVVKDVFVLEQTSNWKRVPERNVYTYDRSIFDKASGLFKSCEVLTWASQVSDSMSFE